MIHEKDLDESIARYMGEPEPSIETCRKLAACLYVKKELFGEPEQLHEDQYSYAAEAPTEAPTIDYDSGTEFSAAVNGRLVEDVLPIFDEVMTTIQVLLPKLYDKAMNRLKV